MTSRRNDSGKKRFAEEKKEKHTHTHTHMRGNTNTETFLLNLHITLGYGTRYRMDHMDHMVVIRDEMISAMRRDTGMVCFTHTKPRTPPALIHSSTQREDTFEMKIVCVFSSGIIFHSVASHFSSSENHSVILDDNVEGEEE